VFYGFETPAPRDTGRIGSIAKRWKKRQASIGSGICGVEAFSLDSEAAGDISFAMVREAVEKYIDFEASPIGCATFGGHDPLPANVISNWVKNLPACSNL